MNKRRSVIMALSSIVSAFYRPLRAQNFTGGNADIANLNNKQNFTLALVDSKDMEAGVTYLEISYHGEKMQLTAADIWKALHE